MWTGLQADRTHTVKVLGKELSEFIHEKEEEELQLWFLTNKVNSQAPMTNQVRFPATLQSISHTPLSRISPPQRFHACPETPKAALLWRGSSVRRGCTAQ